MPPEQVGPVGAVVLAAGQSRRMGKPKLVLPWGSRTVIEQVVGELARAGIAEIVVVTGGAREAVEMALSRSPVHTAYNPDFARSEMVASLQIGLRELAEHVPDISAALVVLGDQPTIEARVVEQIIARYRAGPAPLLVPSYQMHRGHPWLAERAFWPDLLALRPEETLRDFLHSHAGQIAYVEVDSPGILKDMDTPEDYQTLRKNGDQ